MQFAKKVSSSQFSKNVLKQTFQKRFAEYTPPPGQNGSYVFPNPRVVSGINDL
jgi:hypothetical protein